MKKEKKTAQKFKDFSTLISFKVKVNSGIPEEWEINATTYGTRRVTHLKNPVISHKRNMSVVICNRYILSRLTKS